LRETVSSSMRRPASSARPLTSSCSFLTGISRPCWRPAMNLSTTSVMPSFNASCVPYVGLRSKSGRLAGQIRVDALEQRIEHREDIAAAVRVERSGSQFLGFAEFHAANDLLDAGQA